MEVNITMMEAGEMIEVTVETETIEDTTEIIETIGETTAGIEIEIGAMTETEVEDDICEKHFVCIKLLLWLWLNNLFCFNFSVFDIIIPKLNELHGISMWTWTN